MKLSERIRAARRKAGLSQQTLARHCGVSRSAVGNWESAAHANPALVRLSAIAKATHVSFEWLATGRGSMALEHDPLLDTPAAKAILIHDPHEQRLIAAWRELPARMQAPMLEMAEELSYRRTGQRRSQ